MHVRCPHCRNAIEIVAEQELTDLTCPSCGSSFNLIPQTESYSPATRTIGHFQLLQPLGTGAFGTVWKAKDTELDRLQLRFSASARSRRDGEMFMRETRAGAPAKVPADRSGPRGRRKHAND